MARKDKQVALRLRLGGKSYSEIQNALGGISKSTLSLWLKGVVLSDTARERLAKREREKSTAALIRRNKNQTRLAVLRKTEIEELATKDISNFSRKELLLVGAALYWAEGYKKAIMHNGRETTHHPVSFTNADPDMLKLFLRFLTEICEVPQNKIKIAVRIFEHMNSKDAMGYWSETLAIPLQNFEKTLVVVSVSSKGRRPFNRLPYGVVRLRINSTNLFHRIMGWIGGMKEKI